MILPRLMGSIADVACPDVGAMFWPVLWLGILLGGIGVLALGLVLLAIFKESS